MEKLTGQEIQDRIFAKMSADQKLEFGAQLWRLGYELAKDKITYANPQRSKKSPGRNREDA